MASAQSIRQKQAHKLHKNWRDYGHWGMFEDDEENNEDTRNLIVAYAAENDEQVFLLYQKPSGGPMAYKPYDPDEYIFNDMYRYITADESLATALCEAHNGPFEEMYPKLCSLDGTEYIYLIWN